MGNLSTASKSQANFGLLALLLYYHLTLVSFCLKKTPKSFGLGCWQQYPLCEYKESPEIEGRQPI
jgi:hypothetical protein